MSDKKKADLAIQEYVNLQRIKAAKNPQEEIAYQEQILKVRLEALGIPTEHLEINVKESEQHA